MRVHVRPEGATVDVSATVPVKPLTGATVIVEVAAVPTVVMTAVGLAVTVKSVTVTITIAVLDIAPLVPVTVTVNVAAVADEQDSVDVCDAPRTRLLGVRVHVRPEGDTVEVSATVPVNPLLGATVIVEVAAVPAVVVTAVGLALRVKPPLGVNVTVAV